MRGWGRNAPSESPSKQLSQQRPAARIGRNEEALSWPQYHGQGTTLLQFSFRFNGQSPEVETFVGHSLFDIAFNK